MISWSSIQVVKPVRVVTIFLFGFLLVVECFWGASPDVVSLEGTPRVPAWVLSGLYDSVIV